MTKRRRVMFTLKERIVFSAVMLALIVGMCFLYAKLTNAMEVYDDGVEVPVPEGHSVIIQPDGYNTAPCNEFYNTKGLECWPTEVEPEPEPDYCEENPTDPKCARQRVCLLFPEIPQCICILNPDNPKCRRQQEWLRR